jgi:hypothetical protein
MKTIQWRAGMIVALMLCCAGFTPHAVAEDVGDSIESGIGKVEDLMNIYDSWQAFAAAHDSLTPGDRQFDPDYSPPGSPQIPSACAGSEQCNACYEKAVKDINFYRFSLDKGRGIANNTLQYARKAMAFGDTASGSMGVGGLAWTHKAKPQIEKAAAHLRKTYQGKYTEWIAGMQTSLQALGKCEEEFFKERDWYNRFGYIYYSFMADRYKSPD